MGSNEMGGWNSMVGMGGPGFPGLQLGNQAQQGMPQMMSPAGLMGLQGAQQGFGGTFHPK